jgi:GT2 family glycosyltransferase
VQKTLVPVRKALRDGTHELLSEWARQSRILRIVRLPVNQGQAGARNAGAEAAVGEYLFYGEDDYEPTPGQITTLLGHLESSGADMIAGRRINVLPGESYQAALLRVQGYLDPVIERWAMVGNHHMDAGRDVPVPLLDACALIRKEVFRHVSFDRGFKGNGWREESDFQIGALKAGFRLEHCPHTLGFHSPGGVGKARGGSRNRSRLNYELWVVRNNARFLRKHWEFLRSDDSGLRVTPWLSLTVLLQAALRLRRGAK